MRKRGFPGWAVAALLATRAVMPGEDRAIDLDSYVERSSLMFATPGAWS